MKSLIIKSIKNALILWQMIFKQFSQKRSKRESFVGILVFETDFHSFVVQIRLSSQTFICKTGSIILTSWHKMYSVLLE